MIASDCGYERNGITRSLHQLALNTGTVHWNCNQSRSFRFDNTSVHLKYTIFGTMRLTRDFKKNSKKILGNFPHSGTVEENS